MSSARALKAPWWREPSWVQILVFAALPILYAVGFLEWSAYAISAGLGFLPLQAAQYLAAGLFTAAFVALGLGIDIGCRILVARRYPKFVNWSPIIGKTLGMGMAVLALLILSRYTPFLGFSEEKQPLLILIYGILFGIGEVAARGVSGRMMVPSAQLSNAKIGRPGSRRRKSLQAVHMRASRKSILFGTWGLIVILVLPLQLLPAIEPEFGGAKPRRAYMDLEWRLLSNQTGEALFPVFPPSTAGVAQTREVAVLFSGQDVWLVRLADKTSNRDPLIEVRSSVVRAITWIT